MTPVPLLGAHRIGRLPERAREVVLVDEFKLAVDGPSGAGKTTIVRHLAQMLVAQGEHGTVTAEPPSGPIGNLTSDREPAQ